MYVSTDLFKRMVDALESAEADAAHISYGGVDRMLLQDVKALLSLEQRPATKHTSICLQKAADDEPIFVLRAHDMLAPDIIRLWSDAAWRHGCTPAKVASARQLASDMELWPDRKCPD